MEHRGNSCRADKKKKLIRSREAVKGQLRRLFEHFELTVASYSLESALSPVHKNRFSKYRAECVLNEQEPENLNWVLSDNVGHYSCEMTRSKLETAVLPQTRGTNIDGRASRDVTHARLPVEISPTEAKKREI